MPVYRSQNRRAYVEPERHDELTTGVPRDVEPVQAGDQKRAVGRFQPGESRTRVLASRGGAAHRGRTHLSHSVAAPTLSANSVRRARALRRALAAEIAATVGGGEPSIFAALLIKCAAVKMAAAEEATERGDFENHRKLSESARNDLLYAREHVAKAAEARANSIHDPVPAMRARAAKAVEDG